MEPVRVTKSTSCAMHDPLCVGVVLDPDIVRRTITIPVWVETTLGSLTQGTGLNYFLASC
jgi:hypothetical protein